MNEVAQLLRALEQGDPHEANRLQPLAYDELLRLAVQRMARKQSRHAGMRPDRSIEGAAMA
jgi:hypothetical protein